MKKNRKVTSSIYYACSLTWFVVAIMYYTGGDNKTIGITYFCIGVTWLCLGSVFAGKEKKESKTLDYYNQNVTDFVAGTENADISENREKFLSLIPSGGRILDWGCGSGRDTLAFKEAGFEVEAMDASEELCKLASEKTDIKVENMTFDELDKKEKYDGIWACASLLHVENDYLPETIERAKKSLKPGGVMYVSFKYGSFEGERNGRFFTDMTEERFANAIKGIKKIEIIEQWITADVREGREDEKWLNLILRKSDIN